jgi:hypothetical protein
MLLIATAILTAASAAAQPPTATRTCPRTTSYLADKSGLYQGQPLRPRKLTELPPGTAYMAVYRRIGGCEAPLTMIEYRNPRQRR